MSRRNQNLLLVAVGVISFSLFVGIANNQIGSFGFPLDDGWIHQTYARNFADSGEWAYVPGKTSGGSTSPLWTLILSLAHLVKTGPFIGTYIFSMLLFLIAGFLFQGLFNNEKEMGKEYFWLKGIPIFGLFFLLEWRMNWAAVSGMEIMLYIVVILAFFRTLQMKQHYWLVGLLAGIAIWVRPDGLTLLGPLFFVIALGKDDKKEKWQKLIQASLAFLPFVIGYFVFNLSTAGTWVPNTFFAKQSEYAGLYQISLIKRFFQLAGQPLISAGVVFLPGLLFLIYGAVKKKDWQKIAILLWGFGYIAIYAVRLPVIYQHARYLMPAMPALYFLGLLGTLQLISAIKVIETKLKLIRFGIVTLVISLVCGFWVLGLSSFISDTKIIHQEMVEASVWIRDNIASNEVIAAHDIGALGYYGQHDIVDLAGLISPDVIPFITDEAQLLNFLEVSNVKYVMSLSNWYDDLTANAEVVYSSDGLAVLEAGGQPMEVYKYEWVGE